jgi:hypothetical protein
MATSGGTQDQDTADILCGICESQHITKCADHWCPECEEGLCSRIIVQNMTQFAAQFVYPQIINIVSI